MRGPLRVEIPGELHPRERPGLVDANVEAVKRFVAPGERRGVDRRVGARVRVVHRRCDGRVRTAAHVAPARAELPTATESIAPERGEDVRLIVLEEVKSLRVVLASLATREGVGDPTEEPRVGLVAEKYLAAVDSPRARVRVRRAVLRTGRVGALNDEVVELLVEALDRQLDVA